jgi:M6 family metalloprotease-like protein
MKRLAKLVTVILPLILVASNSYAAVKPGAACKTSGQTKFASGKKYTCIKKGKTLVWNKGLVLSKPAQTKSDTPVKPEPVPTTTTQSVAAKIDFSKTFSTDQGYYTDFTGPCQEDRELDVALAEIQKYFIDFQWCAGQMRINKYNLGKNRPIGTYDAKNLFSDTEPCKMVTPAGVQANLGYTTAEPWRNQYESIRKFPSPNAVIQLIPIYSTDSAQPKNSPAQDYGIYMKLLKDWFEYSADFPSSVDVRIPDQYIRMNNKIGDYQLLHTARHDAPNHIRFNRDLVAAVDPVIDFKGVNIVIAVPPAGSDASVLAQAAIGSLDTAEGFVALGTTQQAHLAANPSREFLSELGHPFWWIHELFHAGVGFDDHYGDKLQNIDTEYGMGWLTMMTPWGGDLSTWEKWRLGFMKDSQVQCVTKGGSSTHWIAPSTVQTDESKAIVIRVSATKAIVVETLRPAGLYYKLPIQSQGALVYELDITETRHGYGMKLSLPIGRTVNSNPFFMASYPLKQGESTISNGYKISIVESGTFGDVVKVEKI